MTVTNSAASKGPASYLPSIEKKHGPPIADWQQILRAHPNYVDAKHVDFGRVPQGRARDGHANALVAHTCAES
jgi:hypothetical protein